MDFINHLFYISENYFILSLLIGFLGTFIESFLPMIPLIALVTTNAIMLGFWLGLVVSWLGSVAGSILLFVISSKFSDKKIFKKIRTPKVDKMINWIQSKGFMILFLAYACPFIPAFAFTIASGIYKRKFNQFVSAVFAGRFLMFVMVSYIGNDINGFLHSPTKIGIVVAVGLICWKVGKSISSKMEKEATEEVKTYNEKENNRIV